MSSNHISIRRTQKSDLEQLLSFGKSMFDAEKKFFPLLTYSVSEAHERYEKQISDERFLFLIAELDQQPVGYLYAHLDSLGYVSIFQPRCEIEVVYVEPQVRGRGVAQQLIGQAISWAQEHHAFQVTAGIFAENELSKHAFERSGFSTWHITYAKVLAVTSNPE